MPPQQSAPAATVSQTMPAAAQTTLKSPVSAPVPTASATSQPGEIVAVSLEKPQPNSFFTLRGQLRSLAFGFACGGLVVLAFLFTVFNQLVITPFIQPSKNVVTPPAVDTSGALINTSPRVLIPRINVEIPIVYNLTTTNENQFELALDQGVVHYPTTAFPGQAGNAAFFGHSSNNIFNPGKYKFAFVLLHELTVGDDFYLAYNDKLYTYQVTDRRIVKPTEISVLGPVAGQAYTATLITCDPPGTSNNRLVVIGEQIDPDPNASTVPTAPDASSSQSTTPASSGSLPGNGPGFLTRLWRSLTD
jgi:sortase A